MSRSRRLRIVSRKLDEYDGPGGHFVVEEYRGLRLLLSEDGTTQGAVDLADPARPQLEYLKAMGAVLAFGVPERILVVGLGAATLPRMFRQLCPRAHVTVVEIDPGVVALARRHFAFAEDERLVVRVQDARAFLDVASERWDLVVLDAYAGDSVPEHLRTRDWFELVRSRLTPRGVVASNVFASEESPIFPAMVRLHRSVFGELFLLPCGEDTNRIIVGRLGAGRLAVETLLARLAALDASGVVSSLAYDALRDHRRVTRLPVDEAQDGMVGGRGD